MILDGWRSVSARLGAVSEPGVAGRQGSAVVHASE